jgi:hypothetical protein
MGWNISIIMKHEIAATESHAIRFSTSPKIED